LSLPTEVLPPRLRAALEAGAELDDVAAATLEGPLGSIEVAVRSPSESGWADGLFGPEGFVLAASDDVPGLMTGVVPAVPLQIAKLVALGPRPSCAEPEVVVVGDLSGVDDALAAGDLPAAVAGVIAAPDAMQWLARARWLAPDGPVEREVVVFDGGAAGLLLCMPLPDGDDVALLPCSSTDVWRALCALLPYPRELA